MPPVFSTSPSLRPNQPKLVSTCLTAHTWEALLVCDESRDELHTGTASPCPCVDALLQVCTFGASCKQRVTNTAVLKLKGIRDRMLPYVSQKRKNSHRSMCISPHHSGFLFFLWFLCPICVPFKIHMLTILCAFRFVFWEVIAWPWGATCINV